MRIFRNQAHVRRRATVGKWFFWVALGVLLGGMFSAFALPQYPFFPLIALGVGFVLARLGTVYLNRFVRPDRPDVALSAALKGFSDHYALYHYVAPAAHVLLAPEACYVFVVKLQAGRVTIAEGRGSQPVTLGRIVGFFGQEDVGDLAREAQAEAEALKRYVAARLPGTEVTPIPVVVFTQPQVQLEVRSSGVPVLHAKQLKDWLRGPGKARTLAALAREQLAGLLDGQEAGETA